jgi:hypothetical protein
MRNTAIRAARNAAIILTAIYAVISFIAWEFVSPFETSGSRAFTVYWLVVAICFGVGIELSMAGSRTKAAGIPVREG